MSTPPEVFAALDEVIAQATHPAPTPAPQTREAGRERTDEDVPF